MRAGTSPKKEQCPPGTAMIRSGAARLVRVGVGVGVRRSGAARLVRVGVGVRVGSG